MFSKEIIEQITELHKNWLSINDIKEHIELNNTTSITGQTIRNIINNKGLKQLDESVIEKKLYDINDWHYVFYRLETNQNWYSERIPYPIKITTVDQIFKDYSKHWNNMTWESIIQKYNIKPETRSLLKSRLRLYKESNIVSPYTLENMPKDEIDDYLEWKISETIQDKYKNTFVKKDKAIKKREFIKYSNFYHSQQDFLKNVENILKNYKPKTIGKCILPKINNNDTFDYAFGDIHIWKEWTDEVIKRLQIITEYLISRPEKNLNLLFLWDLAESLVEWWMHPWQVEGMDWPFGFNLMMYVVEILENMLFELYKSWKKIRFIWIPWNHDRISRNHNEDQARTGALVIFELIKRGVSWYDIELEYHRTKTTVIKTANFDYIINHWDEWFAKKAISSPEKILWDYLKNTTKYVVVLFADQHNLKVIEWKWYTVVGLWALAGAGSYDTRLWLFSEPSWLGIEKNHKWTADLLVKRL